MKKYIPYIVILLISYLMVAFVKMQFNPQYWKVGERGSMLLAAFGVMVIYPIVKWIIKDLKK
jgi:hypothetical protein